MVNLRPAKKADFKQIMDLICQARVHLKKLGVEQWQGEYPDRACIEEDILLARGYMLEVDQTAAGYLVIDFDGEPSYESLKGQWKSQKPYGVIHRLTVADAYKGRGLSAEAFRLTEELCSARGIQSIKVDTDENNEAMKHVLDRCGYSYCGTICFDKSEKIAYEKLIEKTIL